MRSTYPVTSPGPVVVADGPMCRVLSPVWSNPSVDEGLLFDRFRRPFTVISFKAITPEVLLIVTLWKVVSPVMF